MAKSLAKTPAPAKDRIYGSKVNPKGSASSEKSAKNIQLSAKTILALSKKLKEFKETNNTKKVSLNDLKAVYRRGLGAYSSTHRPTITGGVPNSRNAWAMARVNAFLRKAGGGESKKAYVQDDDLLKMHLGGDMSKHLAPNGKPSNLTHEQWHLVRTPEFKAWFGDWENDPENASKVVDEKGEPLVVYHATDNDFNVFKENDTYFSKIPIARFGKRIIDCFLNLRKPYILHDANSWQNISISNKDERWGEIYDYLMERDDVIYLDSVCDWARQNGYDGVIALNISETESGTVQTDDYISFKPNQIKLADGTNKTFDMNNPDIRYAEGGSVDDKKETYKKWKSLVNMSYSELEKFYNSKEGKEAGLSSSEAKAQGISSGRESARMILKMKSTPNSKWTDNMWKWANKQISFISRMSGMKGDLYDDKGNKTRKHTSLLIWGHNPKKYNAGGVTFADRYEKNKWVNINHKELGDFKDEIYDLIDKSYSHVGGNLEFKNAMDVSNSDLDIWYADDIDSDPYIDAIIGGKTTKSGIKLTTIAQDGGKNSKLILLKKVKDLIQNKGFYAEVSKDIADGLNIPYIKDKQLIKQVITKPDIEFNSDGSYSRSIHGKRVTKVLVGVLNKEYKKGGETSTKYNDGVIYHEKNGNFFVRKNTIYYWLYDNDDAGEKLRNGEYDFVMFPPATLGMAMQRGFVPPLKLIWTKKYQKNTKGSEHLIGIIQAYYLEKDRKLYIEMMTSHPKMRGKGIMSHMVKELRKEFDLSQDDLIFVDTTKEGKRFEQAKHYEEGGLIAPNGRKSNLTPEQYKLVRTPEFKAWFGDWENDPANASKVVDENGEPLVVYHGTMSGKFNIFLNEKSIDKLFYFHKDKKYAIDYSRDYYGGTTENSYVFEVFLNLRNPLNGYKKYYEDFGSNDGADLRDGRYIVLSSNQIKLADGTNTTFDGSNPDIRYEEGGNIYENVGFTEEQIENWKDEHRVKQRQEQNPNVKESALKLKSGEISQDEYIKSVRKNLPIVPFTEVPQIPTLLEIVGALQSNQLKTGIIGYTKFIDDGEQVATRLDIPAYNNYDVWVVSVHDAKEKNAIGYGQTAFLKDITFTTSPRVALRIATNLSKKDTIARMRGTWINKDPHEVREMAVKYMNDPEWVQVGMNPYRHSWFYDKSDGMPLLTAEELIQVGALVLAKNPVKTTPDNPIFIVPKSDPEVKFKDGGIFKSHKTIEQIAKEKNVSLPYAKNQLKKGMEVESEHSSSKEVQETIALQHLDEMIDYYDKLKTIEK